MFHAFMAPPPSRVPSPDDTNPGGDKIDPLLDKQWGLNNNGQTEELQA